MTDLDWIPELWILRHDNDQHNAHLARQIFEENALDVPEKFFLDLRPFLGLSIFVNYLICSLNIASAHDHECIRTSCALSLPDAASQWPSQVHSIVKSLEDLYREKVLRNSCNRW